MHNSEVVILTAGGKPRSKNLVSKLYDLHTIHNSSKFLNKLNSIYHVNQNLNIRFIGRKITINEKKCLLGHHSLYANARKEWLVVFEDDSFVDKKHFVDFLGVLDSIKLDRPTIILLYIGTHGVFLKQKSSFFTHEYLSVHRCLALPSGAVSYAINSRARNLISNSTTLVGTADWPNWSANVRYYCVLPKIVEHDFTLKSITKAGISEFDVNVWPITRFQPFHMFIGLFRPSLVFAYGGIGAYFKLNIKPAFFRKLSRKLKSFFIRT
jgi:hypothetical protein